MTERINPDIDIEPEIDLTPRSAEPQRSSRRWLTVAVVVALVAGFGFLVVRGLGDAAVFFKNADEAVAERDELGDDRFRLQGTVAPGTLVETVDGAEFNVVFNDATVKVVHSGSPVELFQESIPVVLEGHWDGDVYASDWMAVKHTEIYVEEHEDRVTDAEEQVPGGSGIQ